MPRQKAAATEPIQPPLVPLTEEEILERQKELPALIGTLEDMKTNHAGQRSQMKSERSELQKRINNMAQQLRQNGR